MQRHHNLLILMALIPVTALAEPPEGKEPLKLREKIEGRRGDELGNVVTALMYTPDSKTLAAASMNGTVRLFDAEAVKVLHTLKTSSLEVYAIAISPDGKYLASGGTWPEIQIWEIATGKELQVLKGHGDVVAALKFSPDGKLLASGAYDKSIILWDTSSWAQKAKLTGGLDRVTSLSFSPDGKVLASGGTTTSQFRNWTLGQADLIRLWDVASGKLKQELTTRGSQVDIAPDGRSLMASGLVLGLVHNPNGDAMCGWSSVAWTSLDGGVVLLNTAKKGIGSTVAHSADWRWFVTTEGYVEIEHFYGNVVGCDDATPWHAQIWESTTRGIAIKFPVTEVIRDYLTVFAFSSDSKYLAFGYHGGRVTVHGLSPKLHSPILPDAQAPFALPTDIWQGLTAKDAAFEYALEWQLLAKPDETVKLLGDKLKPVPDSQIDKVRDSIKALDDGNIAVREAALSELRKTGMSMLPALENELSKSHSVESRTRLKELLREFSTAASSENSIRDSRAIGLLERIATPEARSILKSLANGAAGATLTELAQSAVRRLGP